MAVALLISLLEQSQTQKPVRADTLLRYLIPVRSEICDARRQAPPLEPDGLQRLISVLCSWLRAHEDFPDDECMCALLSILARLLGHDPTADNIAVQKGLLSSATAFLSSGRVGSQGDIARQCFDVIATLNVIESTDKIIARLGTLTAIIELIEKHQDKPGLQEDAITTLALMAKRTRHRRAMAQSGGGVATVLGVLHRACGGGQPSLVVAVCRFLSNFAVKAECSLSVLQHGGVDALMVAFDTSVRDWGRQASREQTQPLDVSAAVASALLACSADSSEAQAVIIAAGWPKNLAQALRTRPQHGPLMEASLGVIRALSKNTQFRSEIVRLGFVHVTIAAMQDFGENGALLKEACGVFGNLATDAEIRVQLGECGVMEEVFATLKRCQTNDDRKTAKLALGALSNLTNATPNRDLLARLGVVPVLLDTARIFISNENVLEYAIGVISHLAVHETCNSQLITAGGVEALLLFITEHREDLQVVSKSLIALRRLMKHSRAPNGMSPNPAVVQQVASAGYGQGAHGAHLLVEAMQAHIYDETAVRETAALLTSLTSALIPGILPALMETALQPCMKALELHQNDALVSDTIAGLLAQLPLEEDEAFACGKTPAAAANASATPLVEGIWPHGGS